MATVSTGHVELDERGTARITGSRIRVIDLILDKRAYGWGAEQIQAQHPDLSLAEIHAAFAYYYDHQTDLDAEIARRQREVELLAAQAGDSPIRDKLRALGHIE